MGIVIPESLLTESLKSAKIAKLYIFPAISPQVSWTASSNFNAENLPCLYASRQQRPWRRVSIVRAVRSLGRMLVSFK